MALVMAVSIAKPARVSGLPAGFIDLDLCLMKNGWHSREPWRTKYQDAQSAPLRTDMDRT